jgi:hypothetical protein
LLRRFCQENCPGTLRWIFAIPSSCNVKKILWLDQHKFIYPHILTTACNFSSLVWPDGSAPAALASLHFDPPEPQIIRKTQWIATYVPFSRTCIFFLLTLSLLW